MGRASTTPSAVSFGSTAMIGASASSAAAAIARTESPESRSNGVALHSSPIETAAQSPTATFTIGTDIPTTENSGNASTLVAAHPIAGAANQCKDRGRVRIAIGSPTSIQKVAIAMAQTKTAPICAMDLR
jgi:hypothetical protein